MFDEDEDKAFEQLKRNSDRTDTLASTINIMRTKDFTRMMGSGLIISITDLERRSVTETFMMRAEDMQKIAPLIAESLLESLKLRKLLVASELKTITEILEKKD